MTLALCFCKAIPVFNFVRIMPIKKKQSDNKKIFMTKSGYKDLKAEYDDLVNVQRPAIVADISAARELGDLRENGFYTSSREKQSFIEGRICEIESIFKNVEIIDNDKTSGVVSMGSKVKVKVLDNEIVYEIVGSEEVSTEDNRISHESPLGCALLGKKLGEVVEFDAPVGKVVYKIIEIS